ncbi:hypothetical protein PsorP6_010198 [Peronosclerospora sorghi]|uniref:Uncharacterized protein n=1 Tax=Peronosclerospora sorghi TaxID=230839 RepID=A0ACC0VVY3_9STRA|nr:hypothetical protein PsorP6_010198 [Peronosclerospora sorghi]
MSFVTADQLAGNDIHAADTESSSTPDMVPIGIMKTKIKAKNNTVLISDSNMLFSMSDRVKLAQTIKEMSAVNPEAGAASTMSTGDLSLLLAGSTTTPGLLSHAAGIISSTKSGDTSALAGHVVGLLSAVDPAKPVVAPSATPAAAASPDVSVSDAATIST